MLTLHTIALLCFLNAPEHEEVSQLQVRNAVQTSIPYIEKQGQWWIDTKKCVSCHRVGNMIWSLTLADQHGYAVSDRLDEWRAWAVERSLSTNDDGKITGTVNREGVAQLILSAGPARDDSTNDETSQRLFTLLQEGHRDDGLWKPGGQLPSQKRSKDETTVVSSMWLTLALRADRQADTATIASADAAIAASQTGISTEWFVLQSLLAALRDDEPASRKHLQTLAAQQNEDGGWGWLVGDDSDALGTGMALYAIARAEHGQYQTAISRAQSYLVGTQREDGSWAVRGTKKGRKDKIQETATYWGTTWAVMGLIQSHQSGP